MLRIPPRWRRTALTVSELERRLTPAGGIAAGSGWTVWNPTPAAGVTTDLPSTVWQPTADGVVARQDQAGPQWILPLTLDEPTMLSALAEAPAEADYQAGDKPLVIALPRPDGRLERFELWSVPTLHPELAAQFPGIHTFRGRGIDDPTAILAADFTDQGFHAAVSGDGSGYTIEPITAVSTGAYAAFFHADYLPHHGGGCGCEACHAAAAVLAPPPSGPSPAEFTNGANLRTFRLAVAATGEYTAAAGGSVPLGLSAVTTVVNAINAVFERDLAVRFTIVPNNDLLIYTNAATDPYTGNNASAMLGENQTNLDAVIGSSNYDLGHVFGGNGLGGVAFLASVGNPTLKAQAVSTMDGSNNPTNYWMRYVTAHEMGHQFGAGHTFNGVSSTLTPNRMSASAWEPGSGSTIMSYGHIGQGNGFVPIGDLYFHSGSVDEMLDFIATIPTVGTTTPTGNGLPTANAGPDYSIPANTPFVLTGTSVDPDGDPLTFTWEQLDLGPALALGSPDNGSSPLFRSLPPSADPNRTIRNLADLLANNANPAEVLPSTSRAINFRFTARDNRPGFGATVSDDMTVTTVDTGTAFRVTSPNTPLVWPRLSTQTVTWDVAGTTGNGINTSLVTIDMSADGGLTYPLTLAANTPNDGSQTIFVPDLTSERVRVRVRAVGNIFFDVSDTAIFVGDFTPGATVVTNDLASGPGSLRQALINANFTPGVDTITFDPAFFATPRVIPWTGGPIETLESLAIQGPAGRVTIDAGGSSRIFRLATSGSGAFNISNLIFANGRAVDAGGGAVVIGFDDQATFTNCSFTGNSAAGSGGAALHEGGPGGRLTFLQSTLTANTSASTGGAIMLEGGSTATASQLTVTDSTISGNRGTLGAGIYFRGFANVTITRSTLASNSASDIGGAVCTLGSASTAAAPSALTIVASAIVDNRATRGGGVMVQSRTVTTIESSTVSGNQTTEPANGRGGGIAVFGFATAGASFSMFNSTVTNNKSVGLTGGGIHLTRASSQPVVVQNSVISGNVQSDNTSPDFYGPATATGGHAFIGNIGTQPTTFSGSGNIIGTPASPVDALLAPIWTNGGPTLTHAPLPGSPLRDAGGSTAATTDQRGSPRTSGTAPDIGAVEIQQVAVTGVQINDGSAQRSRVSSLTVNFTGPVTVAAGAFQLVRQSDGAAVTMTATPSGNAVILSLTAGPVEFGSLADGRYTLTVTAAGVNQGGLPADFTLAGNPANGLFRLFGDSNGSGTVDANDFLAFRTAFLGTNPVFDFDGNGTVDAGDFLRFRVRFLQSV